MGQLFYPTSPSATQRGAASSNELRSLPDVFPSRGRLAERCGLLATKVAELSCGAAAAGHLRIALWHWPITVSGGANGRRSAFLFFRPVSCAVKRKGDEK